MPKTKVLELAGKFIAKKLENLQITISKQELKQAQMDSTEGRQITAHRFELTLAEPLDAEKWHTQLFSQFAVALSKFQAEKKSRGIMLGQEYADEKRAKISKILVSQIKEK